MNKFICVSIDKFYEARKSSYKQFDSVEELKEECDTDNGSTFEVLRYQLRRIYLDIEKIPSDDNGLIFNLIRDWCNFLDIDEHQYFFTKNIGSHHGGLSYHLYFPFKTFTGNIYNAIRCFKVTYPQYAPFIDECVYNTNRLFRLPEQFGVGTSKTDNHNDVHHIVRGNFEDCVIQNISNIPMLEKQFNPVSNRELILKNIKPASMSGPRRPNGELMELYNLTLEKQSENIDARLRTVSEINSSVNGLSLMKCIRDVIICSMITFLLWSLFK